MTRERRTSTEAADFEQWYEDVSPRVYRAVYAIVGKRSAAEDVVADAFTRAWAKWEGGLASSPSADGWVWQVALNLVKRRSRIREFTFSNLPDRRHDDVKPDGDVWRAVGKLPLRQRQVVVLRYIGGFTEKEIADLLDVSQGSISASLHKARSKLRLKLGESHG